VKIRREEEKEQRKTHKSARNHRSTQKRQHTYDLLLIRMNGTTTKIRATSSGVGPDQTMRPEAKMRNWGGREDMLA
jgi:hypothetical protein